MAQTQTVDPKAYYGYLFAQKQPTKLLDALLRGIANYISDSVGDGDDKNLSPSKLAGFYKAVGGNYDSLFVEVPHSSISWIYASIGCQHTLQPTLNDFRPPSVPALTTRGFVRWQSIEILLGPEEHVPFIQYAVNNFDIKNPDTGESFPKDIPTEAFPLNPDAEIEAWHSSCAEKLRQQATPTEEEARLHHNISPRPKVQTGYAHVRPAHAGRERPETRDYFGPNSKPKARPIPHQHVSGTSRPTRPSLSSSPGHRQRQFLAPEEVTSPRSGRSRRRSFPDVGSPLASPQDGDSPTLGPPAFDYMRRHSHPRHARRGSCSSDASSERDDPPSPKTGSHAPGAARPPRPRRADAPPIRVAFAPPLNASPPIPASPDPRPRTREGREKEEEAKRMGYPIPIDLSGKLSAPFLMGRKERERPATAGAGAGANSRSTKVGWKDLSGVQNALHQSSRSSEEDRERELNRDSTSRRHSREEGAKESGGSSDFKRRNRERDKERDQEGGRTPRNRHSSHEDVLPKRERERDRDREERDRDRDRDRDADGRAHRDRYYTSAR